MLSDDERRFLAHRRVAHLATADARGVPHVVPVCFVVSEGTLYITIDEKPKRNPGTALKRLRNIAENPAVALVVDRYDEDWALLGWVMLHGHAEILIDGTEHNHAQALAACPVPAARGDADRAAPGHRCTHRADDELGQPVDRGPGLTTACVRSRDRKRMDAASLAESYDPSCAA